MPDKLIKRLEKSGKIRKQKAGFVKKIFTEAKAQNPQLELKFKLNEK